MRASEFIKEQWAPGAIDPNKSVEQHYIGRYSPADQEQIGKYVDTNRTIQQMLNDPRAEQILKDPKMSWITDPVKALDKISQQRTTPFDMTVHRGLEKMPQLDKDNVMTNKGYLSTSTDPEFAKYWAGLKTKERDKLIQQGKDKNLAGMLHPDYQHTMQIQVPKGTPGFYASDAQSEWVAPRGSQVKVNPTPTIDHKSKTVSWQGQYQGNQPQTTATAPKPVVPTASAATAPRSTTLTPPMRGRGGGGSGGQDLSDPRGWQSGIDDVFQTSFDPKRTMDQMKYDASKRGYE